MQTIEIDFQNKKALKTTKIILQEWKNIYFRVVFAKIRL